MPRNPFRAVPDFRLLLAAILASILAAAGAAAAVPAAGGPAGAPPAGPADTVVLLSIDGMRWDYPAKTEAPALSRMAAEGASARTLIPPFPTVTFPAHASLVTGVHPDRHGIMNNEFLDRGRGLFRREDDASWLLAEPLWVTAERQGIRSAVFHWVFSYTPWHGIAATRRVPFSAATPDAEKVDRILDWLSLEGADRPRLILSYLHGPDAAGHGEGPESPAVFRRVRQTDRLVGRILRALAARPRSALVVVSDHGMAAVSRVLRTRDILGAGEARRARPVSSGAVCNIYCPDARSCTSAQAALKRIDGMTVYRLEDLPAALRYALPSRTGDLVAIAPRGAYFAHGGAPAPPARGMHGFPPDEMEMRGIFRAWGAGVKKGARLDTLRAVDVAPFVCRLLGIDPAAGLDGRVPEGLLSAARGSGSAPP
ncbi:MAG: alkaline phosphatase family protein [Acidobacteria bacterium]|nr:alkaline phosphatase family protein [Acidobacteriota bacterium]